jgi:hypothetical protein
MFWFVLGLGRPCPTVADNIFVVVAMSAAGDVDRPVANDTPMTEGGRWPAPISEKARSDLRRS